MAKAITPEPQGTEFTGFHVEPAGVGSYTPVEYTPYSPPAPAVEITEPVTGEGEN